MTYLRMSVTIPISVVFLLISISPVARAQDTGAVFEFDPGFGVAIDLSRRTRLDLFAGKEKSEELHSDKGKVSAGISFRLEPVFKTFLDDHDRDKQHVLVLGAAYEFSHASKSGTITNEHKIMLDGTVRYAFFRDVLLSDRNRFELRWINGAYHFRYRNRLMIERPVRVIKRKLTPYGAVEPFWDSRYDKWDQFRFTAGVQIPFIRRSKFDVYYERQHCVTCSDPNTNVLGLKFDVYLRRKK